MCPDFGGHSKVASLSGNNMNATPEDKGNIQVLGIDVSESESRWKKREIHRIIK